MSICFPKERILHGIFIFFRGDSVYEKKRCIQFGSCCHVFGSGIVLPQIMKSIPLSSKSGYKIIPMHIPVLLCGYLWILLWAFCRLYSSFAGKSHNNNASYVPVAISMAFELAAYGLVAGLMYKATSN